MEAWIEKTTEYKAFKDKFDEERQRRLEVTSVADLQSEEPMKYTSLWFDNFDGAYNDDVFAQLKKFSSVNKVTFSTRFELTLTADLLNRVLAALPNVINLSINNRIAWNELVGIDLSNIVSLYASISDKMSEQFLSGEHSRDEFWRQKYDKFEDKRNRCCEPETVDQEPQDS